MPILVSSIPCMCYSTPKWNFVFSFFFREFRDMRTIYIQDNGLMLKRISNRILVKKDGKVKDEIAVMPELKRIVVRQQSDFN